MAPRTDLEELVELGGKLAKVKFSPAAQFVTILDASGKVVHLRDMPFAYLALVAEGLTDKLRELEKVLKTKADATKHSLAAKAAAVGYEAVLSRFLGLSERLDATHATQWLAADLELITRVTGVKPIETLQESVFSAMAKFEFNEVVPAVEHYVKKTSAVPSERVAQRLYLSVITSEADSSAKRVGRLQAALGFPPKLHGQEYPTIDDYVITAIKATGQERLHHDPLAELKTLAAKTPWQFQQAMEKQFAAARAESERGYALQSLKGVLNFLAVAAYKKVQLPESVSSSLESYLVMSLAQKGVGSSDITYRVVSILATLAGCRIYTVDGNKFAGALTEGLRFLAEELTYARQNLQGNLLGGAFSSVVSRAGNLTYLAYSLRVELCHEASPYAEIIRTPAKR